MAGPQAPPSPPCRVGQWEAPNRRYYGFFLKNRTIGLFVLMKVVVWGGAVQQAEDPLKGVKKANCSWSPQSQGHKSPVPALGCTETNFAKGEPVGGAPRAAGGALPQAGDTPYHL